MRAPFQVLVIPFRPCPEGMRFGVLRRSDAGYWQFVAGGGEGGETPLEAARREAREEAGIPETSRYIQLDSIAKVPARIFQGHERWGPDVLEIPEHAFGAEVPDGALRLSGEHTESRWVGCEEAGSLLKWDSNRNALRELDQRLRSAV